MASIMQDSASGRFYVRFRYAGESYKRSLSTNDRHEANATLSRVNDTLKDIKRGRLQIPDDADPALFILSDGKVGKKPEVPMVRTLADLFRVYEENLPVEAKEESTRKGENTHLKHLRRHLDVRMSVRALKPHDLQSYINRRAKDAWNGEPIRGDTIAKELTTFRLIWNWASRMGHLKGDAPIEGLRFPKRNEREPFMTWEEIERRIARGVSQDVETTFWESLYLTRSQVDEVLVHVKEVARHPFIYPMFVFVAHTGARRSEILRSQIDDFKFDDGVVQIREKKKSRERKLTFRRVEMSSQLSEVMKDWFHRHPGGGYTIAPPINVPRGKCRARSEPLTVSCAHDHFKRTLAGSRWGKIRGFHVFRHSFASNAAYAGVPEAVIDSWMGHQTEEMRRRYRHLFPEQRRSAIESVFGRNGQ